MSHTVKRGVSLYGYQEKVFLGELDLESAIAASASFGAMIAVSLEADGEFIDHDVRNHQGLRISYLPVPSENEDRKVLTVAA